jgi:hypothetical protein
VVFARVSSNRSSPVANQCVTSCPRCRIVGTAAQTEAAGGNQALGEENAYLDSVPS